MALPNFQKSNFGQGQAAQQPPSDASQQPQRRRRRAVVTEAQAVDHKATGVKGHDATGVILSGTFPCYVSAVNHHPKFGQSITFKIHWPGREHHGHEARFSCHPIMTKKNGEPMPSFVVKMNTEAIAKFYKASGHPETSWPLDAANKPVPPSAALFTRRVNLDGREFTVPIILAVTFEEIREWKKTDATPEEREQRGDPPDYVKQGFVSAVPIEPLLIAKLPGIVPEWLARHCGWPVTRKENSNGAYFLVDQKEAAQMDEIFGESEYGLRLDGDDGGAPAPDGSAYTWHL